MKKILFLLPLILALLVSGTIEAKKKKYPNGDYYEGEWKKGAPNGKGVMTYANGNRYVGQWNFGVIEGQGIMAYKNGDCYDGYWEKGEPNGTGTMKYAIGNIYEGEWYNDMCHGTGKMVYKTGDIYEGQWQTNSIYGNGTMKYANGNIYEGNWLNGKQNGTGTMKYANGSIYKGEWLEGKCFQGKLVTKDGEWFDGKWNDNEFHEGTCKGKIKECFLFKGEIKGGTYYNGTGIGEFDGNYYNGEWINGKFVGQCKLRKNGKIPRFEGKIQKNDSINGTVWYENNTIYNGILSSSYVPSGKGTLTTNLRNSAICTIIGIWKEGRLVELVNGNVRIDQTLIKLKMENSKLMIENEVVESMQYNEISNSINDFIRKNIYLIKNGLLGQIEYYEKNFRNKVFMCQMPLDKYMKVLSSLLDISSMDACVSIVFESGSVLRFNRLVKINPDKLRRYDRGYLIQQTMYMKELMKDERYAYKIENGYLLFDFDDNKYKYKIAIDNNSLFDEGNKVTLKAYTEKEAKALLEKFIGTKL